MDYDESDIVTLGWTTPAFDEAADAYLKYDASIDLHTVVETYAKEIEKVLTDATVRFEPIYEFRKPASYISPEDGNTDQQKFVTLDEKTGHRDCGQGVARTGYRSGRPYPHIRSIRVRE